MWFRSAFERYIGSNVREILESEVLFEFLFSGTKIPEKDRCKTCRGEKTLTEKKMLEVVVQRGMYDGQKMYFRGEGDQEVRNSFLLKMLCF